MTTPTLGELAQLLGGTLVGNADQPIHEVLHPALAQEPHHLALVLDKGILPLLAHKPVTTALVPEGLEIASIPNQIKVGRPKVALAKLLEIFDKPAYQPEGIHPTAVIDPTAELGENVQIGPLCIIGPQSKLGRGTRLVGNVYIGANVQVGEDCLFYPGTYVGDRIKIGSRVILQANASIGSDGFSYVTPQLGSVESAKATGRVEAQNTAIIRINSIGTVVLEDEVELGANTCVDRGTLGETRIGRGTKIDNQCQIAHNVTIGENCLFAGQMGISGSTKVGNRVVIGGKAGIPDHVTLGDDCIIMPFSGITSNIAEKTVIMGMPGVPRREFLYKEMSIKRIKGLGTKLEALTQQVNALEAQLLEKTGQPV